LLGGHAQPTFDRSVGHSLALNGSYFARLQLTQGTDVLGKILLAPSGKACCTSSGGSLRMLTATSSSPLANILMAGFLSV
jgi:hypothetical protein